MFLRVRSTVTQGLLGLATVLTVLAVIAIWANRQLLNADNWGRTSTSLLKSPAIRSTTANFVVDELYAKVDVAGQLRSGLPPRLAPLSGPLSGALRSGAVTATEAALARPVVQGAWRTANRAADQALIDVIDGGNRRISVSDGQVTLNLAVIIDDVARRLGIANGASRRLPPAATRIVILRAHQLTLVQKLGRALRGLTVLLWIVVPLLCAAIVLTARHRRRTLALVGLVGVVAGTAVLLVRSLMVAAATRSLVDDASIRPAVSAAARAVTEMLSQVAGGAILLGLVLMAGAWLAGNARLAIGMRQQLAPVMRDEPMFVYAGVLVALMIVFVWEPLPVTGTIAGRVVFTVLALSGAEVLRRQTVREFPVVPDAATVPEQPAVAP